jgi:hypothetical protein
MHDVLGQLMSWCQLPLQLDAFHELAGANCWFLGMGIPQM